MSKTTDNTRVCACGREGKSFFKNTWLCEFHADELCNVIQEEQRQLEEVRSAIHRQMVSKPCQFCGRIDQFYSGRSFAPLVCVDCNNKGRRLPKEHDAQVALDAEQEKWRKEDRRPKWLMSLSPKIV